jgi:antitoxin component of MazEF toxin-antitoxin module
MTIIPEGAKNLVKKQREIKVVKLQMVGGRNFVTIPKSVVNILDLSKGESFGVCINSKKDIVLHRKETI